MFLQEVIRKIVSFTQILSPVGWFTWFTYVATFTALLPPIEWFIWFTYLAILPVCSLLGWLALPFIFVAFIITSIFGAIRLLLRAYPPETSSDNTINEMFVSTREALKTILPQASDQDIEKYDEQLSKVDDLDPVLIISANQNWINQHKYAAYQAVMNAFATDSLRNNIRRDEGSLCIFHFPNLTELYAVRGHIRTQYPNAFFDRNAQLRLDSY